MRLKRVVVNVLIVAGLVIGLFSAVREVRDATAGFAPLSLGRILLGSARWSSPFSKALAHYTMGIIYDNDGQFEKAINEYKKSLTYDPNVGHVRTRLALDYVMTKDEAGALAELDKAKAIDPADMKAHFLSALIYTSSNKFDLAQKECEEMVRIDPESIWALSSLADVFVLQEKMDDAALIYEKMLEKEESALASFNLGVIYSKIGRIEPAIEKLKAACRMDPEYLEALIGLGVLYEAKGDLKSAILSFDRALKVDPLNVKIYRYLGALYQKAALAADAVKQYELIIKLDPKNTDAYLEWADLYIRQKKPKEAIAVLEKAVAAGVADAAVYVGLGYSESLAGNADEALKHYETAREIDPDKAAVYFYMGVLYEKLGRKARAIKELREAIRIDPGYADACNYLGYMFAEDGTNLDEALGLIKKALELDPENGAFIDSLGWVYYKKGMYKEALAELEKAAAIEGDDPIVTEHLGDAYLKNGFNKKAREMWKRSLELEPGRKTVKEKLRK